jgi:tetratricopeptide (TPR) repeat protein
MTAQALPKTQELTDKINSFTLELRRPTDFEIRSLKREINKLNGKIDYADYYDLLGRIAGLENNKNEIIIFFEKAIKLSPNDFMIQMNYGISLKNRGLITLAVEQAKKLVNIFPNDKNALNFLIETLFLSCRFNEAQTLLNNIEDKTMFHNYELTINKALNIFNNAHIDDNEAQYLQKLSYSIIEKKNLYSFQYLNRVSDDSVDITIYVDLPVEEIFDVNWVLAGVLAENVENMRCDVLMFEYSSIEVLRERKQYERII